MSILDRAPNVIVARGLSYYEDKAVSSISQISECEYTAKVEGSSSIEYEVKINIEKPNLSTCTCPYADGNKICKHMIAVYFSVFEHEADEYRENIMYDDEEDDNYDFFDDYGYDDDDYDYPQNTSFERPLFFDEVLNDFVESISVEDLKKITLSMLNKHEEEAYKEYIIYYYESYMNRNKYPRILEEISKNLKNFASQGKYRYDDFDDPLLTKQEKDDLQVMYAKEIKLIPVIDKVLLDVQLTVYKDYAWVIQFYKSKQDKYPKLRRFIFEVEDYFNTIKQQGIREDEPKVNILINLFLLKDYTDDEIAFSLIRNAKYEEYIYYVLDNVSNIHILCSKVKDKLGQMGFNRSHVIRLLDKLYKKSSSIEIYKELLFYRFVYENDLKSLYQLHNKGYLDSYMDRIKKINKDSVYEMLYVYLNDMKSLYEMCTRANNDYAFIRNVVYLRDDYHNELYELFYSQFYNILKLEKSRENYKNACKYLKAIGKLNDGESLIQQIINELKNSSYHNRPALFDEIDHIR